MCSRGVSSERLTFSQSSAVGSILFFIVSQQLDDLRELSVDAHEQEANSAKAFNDVRRRIATTPHGPMVGDEMPKRKMAVPG
jgi:hypothetical protein